MKRIFSIIFLVAFFAISLIPLLSMPFYKTPTNSEKRVLNKRPKPFEDGKPNLNFFSQLNDYFSDNFAFRLEMVHLNELIYTGALKHSTNEQVIFGKNGWLYFHETIDNYTGMTALSDGQVERIATILSLQSEYLESKGIQYIFTVAPNKNTIYPQFMPARFIKSSRPSVLDKLADALTIRQVHYSDLKQALLSENTHKYLYHKTDTHWNDLGARVAANSILQEIKKLLPKFNFNDSKNAATVETKFAGDLKKMLFPLSKSSDDGYTSLALDRLYTVKRPFRSVDDAKITTTCDVNLTRLMMFRDSFGNTIIPFLSNNFGYVHYSREYPVNFSDLDAHSPDIVVHEIAQRNIPKLLNKAPLMPAIKRQIANLDTADANGIIFVQSKGKYVHVYGYINCDESSAYRCYVTDSFGQTFEAFPVFEAEKLPNKSTKSAGFSLYITEKEYVTGDFTVTFDFYGTTVSHTFKKQEVNLLANK